MIRWYGSTHAGNRDNNQDSLWAGWNNGSFRLVPKDRDYRQSTSGQSEEFRGFLGDGMGGGKAGEIASHVAAFCAEHSMHLSPAEVLVEAHQRILTEGLTSQDRRGMATTGVVLDIRNGHASWAHIGDSRLYLIRDGIHRLTKDHSLYQSMVDDGMINEGDDFPRNIIYHVLGRDLPSTGVPSGTIPILDGDMFFLCSDGVTEVFDDEALLDGINMASRYEDVISSIISVASQRGHDNVTALLVGVA